MADSAWVLEVAEADFERDVIERSRERPVVVDFWAPWCGPCRMLGPVLEKLTAERNGEVILAKINIDEAQQLAAQFGVEAIPTVKAFRDGRPVLEFMGLLPEDQLRAFFDRISPNEADRLAQQAKSLEDDKPAEAEALYRRALERQRDHTAALLGLVRVLIHRGKDEEAADLVSRVIAEGAEKEEAERLEAVLFLRQQARELGDEPSLRRTLADKPESAQVHFELGCVLAAAGKYVEALEQLLAAAERDRKLAEARVKKIMVKIFHIVGVRSPMADEYRDKLVRLLY